jgi:hypothetical protein
VYPSLASPSTRPAGAQGVPSPCPPPPSQEGLTYTFFLRPMSLGSNMLGSNYIDIYTVYSIILVKILIKISQVMLERTLTALNTHHESHMLYKLATSPSSSELQKDDTTTIRKAITYLHVREGRRIAICHLATT